MQSEGAMERTRFELCSFPVTPGEETRSTSTTDSCSPQSARLLRRSPSHNTDRSIASLGHPGTGNIRIKCINKKLPWEKALHYCKTNYKGLLWINDEDDQTSVEQWLKYTDVGGLFWSGLRLSHLIGFWIWSDRMVNYSNWKNEKKPALPEPALPVYAHCGAKMGSKWSDEDCLDPKPFLCEEEIVFMNKLKMVNASSGFSHP
ncbi:hypothetical protein EYF80_032337 [Liparis tanakae]|uniref:C-type lectin domain-containing protein n=1 Tax=Liparis tanakae TaxID=230148 RepID=A0A4Z2GVF6_9TELE|nr:hypothetical protein EYF80_032337 [Liparis tanakae]